MSAALYLLAGLAIALAIFGLVCLVMWLAVPFRDPWPRSLDDPAADLDAPEYHRQERD